MMRVLLQSATSALIPPMTTVPSPPKLVAKDFEEATARQSGFGQTSDNARAGDRSVKGKLDVGIDVGVEVVAMMPGFTGGIVAEIECFAARRAAIGAPPIPVVNHWLDGEKMPAGGGESGR